MPTTPGSAGSRLLILGLAGDLANSLIQVLPPAFCAVIEPEPPTSESALLARLQHADADLVFCQANCVQLPALLQTARSLAIPVVVITHQPDVQEWLNAMDAGAADYAAPPFGARELDWILDGNLHCSHWERGTEESAA